MLIGSHPQFELIFGPLVFMPSLMLPTKCQPNQGRKQLEDQETGDNNVAVHPQFEPFFVLMFFRIIPSLMLPTKCQPN